MIAFHLAAVLPTPAVAARVADVRRFSFIARLNVYFMNHS